MNIPEKSNSRNYFRAVLEFLLKKRVLVESDLWIQRASEQRVVSVVTTLEDGHYYRVYFCGLPFGRPIHTLYFCVVENNRQLFDQPLEIIVICDQLKAEKYAKQSKGWELQKSNFKLEWHSRTEQKPVQKQATHVLLCPLCSRIRCSTAQGSAHVQHCRVCAGDQAECRKRALWYIKRGKSKNGYVGKREAALAKRFGVRKTANYLGVSPSTLSRHC